MVSTRRIPKSRGSTRLGGMAKRLKKARVDFLKLTDQEEVFVGEMINSRTYDPKEAAMKAGYANPKTAGNKLLKSERVVRALISARNKRNEEMDFTANDLLKELGYVALRDPIDLCDVEGNIIVSNLSQIPKRMRACIDGIKCTQRTNPVTGEITQQMELKLAPKMQAIELAMKHFGLLEQKTEVTHKLQVDWEKLYHDGSQVPVKALTDESAQAIGLSSVETNQFLPSQSNVIEVESRKL